ncbi:hypothetical protein BJX65DRAFT_71944 [Aspergillus insuetus]
MNVPRAKKTLEFQRCVSLVQHFEVEARGYYPMFFICQVYGLHSWCLFPTCQPSFARGRFSLQCVIFERSIVLEAFIVIGLFVTLFKFRRVIMPHSIEGNSRAALIRVMFVQSHVFVATLQRFSKM